MFKVVPLVELSFPGGSETSRSTVVMPWPQCALELRIEAFNLFNRSNFRAPVTNRSANNFGTITATYDPRIVQLGVKVLF